MGSAVAILAFMCSGQRECLPYLALPWLIPLALVNHSVCLCHRLLMEEQSLIKVKQDQELLIAKLSDSSSGAAYT